MSPKRRMWLLTVAFLFALLAFAMLISGVQGEELHQETKVEFISPDKIVTGTPSDLSFHIVDEKVLDDFILNIQITHPEYEALLLDADFYIDEGEATVTFNFQDTASYVIEATLKDESGATISPKESFAVTTEHHIAPRVAQLKGWLLLMGTLIFGILVGMGSTRLKNISK